MPLCVSLWGVTPPCVAAAYVEQAEHPQPDADDTGPDRAVVGRPYDQQDHHEGDHPQPGAHEDRLGVTGLQWPGLGPTLLGHVKQCTRSHSGGTLLRQIGHLATTLLPAPFAGGIHPKRCGE